MPFENIVDSINQNARRKRRQHGFPVRWLTIIVVCVHDVTVHRDEVVRQHDETMGDLWVLKEHGER